MPFYVKASNYDDRYYCGGTLISNQHILTAAHCVDEGQKAKFLYIRLGAHDKNEPEIEARVKKIDVPSTWNLLDGTTSNNLYGGPDAAVGVALSQFNNVLSPSCSISSGSDFD